MTCHTKNTIKQVLNVLPLNRIKKKQITYLINQTNSNMSNNLKKLSHTSTLYITCNLVSRLDFSNSSRCTITVDNSAFRSFNFTDKASFSLKTPFVPARTYITNLTAKSTCHNVTDDQ